MKKRVIYFLLGTFIVVAAIILIGLYLLMRTNVTESNNYAGVAMTVDDSTLSNTGISVVVKNETEKELTFGEEYTLEKKILGQWYQVMYKPKMIFKPVAWEAIGYPIAPNSERIFEINWEWLYGNLSKGTYRIVKGYIVNYPETYNLEAEFIIR